MRLATLILALGLCGCGTPTATTPASIPGAINSVDAQLYTDLHTAQAAIEQAKVDIAKFPQFKDALNKVIASYNLAEAGYQTYHAGLVGGKTIDASMLQAQVTLLMTDIGKLQVSMGVKK